MIVVLAGYRGSGKTTVGRMLADRLWYRFADVDDAIVQRAGKTIADIFAQDGEEHFRDIETAALRELLRETDLVLGLGGGTLGRQENRDMLRDARARVVYLRCDPQELLRRIQSDPRSAATRPSLTPLGGGLEEINLKLAEREPIYRQCAHVEIDVTRLKPEEVVNRILRLL